LRVVARVRHAHARAAAGEKARHRQAGFAQSQNQRVFARQVHLSFDVDNPNNTSIIVIIQKRTGAIGVAVTFASRPRT